VLLVLLNVLFGRHSEGEVVAQLGKLFVDHRGLLSLQLLCFTSGDGAARCGTLKEAFNDGR